MKSIFILLLLLLPIPSLPQIIPDVSPVVTLKRQVIQNFYLSEDASELLLRTPVHYYYVANHEDTSIFPFVGKFYHRNVIYNHFFRKNKHFEIIIVCCSRPDSKSILMHEFAHKWYFLQEQYKTKEWLLIKEEDLNEYTRTRMRRDYKYHNFDYHEELYAIYTELGPLEMDDKIRKYFYNGLFDEEKIYRIQNSLKEIK